MTRRAADSPEASDREARLARKLRENLARRKAQQRGRADGDSRNEAPDADGPGPENRGGTGS